VCPIIFIVSPLWFFPAILLFLLKNSCAWLQSAVYDGGKNASTQRELNTHAPIGTMSQGFFRLGPAATNKRWTG